VGRRQEKQTRLAALKVLVLAGKVPKDQGEALETAYRRAITPEDFAEVARAVDYAARGWKNAGDFRSHLMRNADDDDDDEPDPPALAAAIERARVKL
jgi:hypothetical protein